MSSALQTESTKLRNENCTIHAKRIPINIVIFKIFKIKWPKSEEKINFGDRWVWLSESSPTQNFMVTAWPWPHLCRPAAAASGVAVAKRCKKVAPFHLFDTTVFTFFTTATPSQCFAVLHFPIFWQQRFTFIWKLEKVGRKVGRYPYRYVLTIRNRSLYLFRKNNNLL